MALNRMTYGIVVLGQVIRRRRTYGYRIARDLDELHQLLEIGDSSTYSVISQFERRGLLRVVEGQGPSWKQRKMIEATEDGHQYFADWMSGIEGRLSPIRESLHMAMLMATDDDVPDIIAALDALALELERDIPRAFSLMESLREKGMFTDWGITLVRDGIVQQIQTQLEWAESSAAALRKRMARAAAEAALRSA